jgi:hypothetical protein
VTAAARAMTPRHVRRRPRLASHPAAENPARRGKNPAGGRRPRRRPV